MRRDHRAFPGHQFCAACSAHKHAENFGHGGTVRSVLGYYQLSIFRIPAQVADCDDRLGSAGHLKRFENCGDVILDRRLG
jgi:hypothetical protein